MLKRLTVAVAALFVLAAPTPAHAAGTINFSLSQQLDEFGNPLANCFLYLIQAGTVSTPQNAYQDSALTLLWPNPMRCDASGRIAQFFLADGSIKIRLTKSNGVNVVTADGILVIGPSGGGGGGSPVDATTVLATGDVKTRYGTGVLAGFVRMNGRTIGSATSGATERANADAQALFEYLWGADANLAVSSGRGASANADWVANKTLTLPDLRGRFIAGLDDMGSSAAGRLTTFTIASPTTLGASGGSESKPIVQGNLPALTWPNTLGISDTRTWGFTYGGVSNIPIGGSNVAGDPGASGFTDTVTVTGGSISVTGSVTSGGSAVSLSVLLPTMLMTVYCKL